MLRENQIIYSGDSGRSFREIFEIITRKRETNGLLKIG